MWWLCLSYPGAVIASISSYLSDILKIETDSDVLRATTSPVRAWFESVVYADWNILTFSGIFKQFSVSHKEMNW